MLDHQREQLMGVTRDQLQARELPLPKRSIRLADGRVLREIIGYRESLLQRIPISEHDKRAMVIARGWTHTPSGLLVSASKALSQRFNKLLHVSASYEDHDPTWDELKMIRAVFFPPDIDAVMILPREGNYVNTHSHCFHLWQLPLEWTIG